MDNTEQFGISLCSGYGGLDIGLKLAGVKLRTVAYVEIEAFAVANLVAKMETGLLVPAPVWANLKTFQARQFYGCVDFITAGYPCQPFSVAGQRKGTDDQRHLWPYIRGIYQSVRPSWMFFENVEGHVSLGLNTVISDLEEDGYIVEAGLFTAAEVGAPHRRKRVFILANSKQSRACGQCEDRSLSKDRRDAIQSDSIQSSTTVDVGRNSYCREHEELGHSRQLPAGVSRTGLSGRSVCCPEGVRAKEGDRLTDASETMAHPNEPRPQGRVIGELQERAKQWPARPGSPQYDWEEPRVVGDSKQQRLERTPRDEQQAKENNFSSCKSEQAQPELGRTVDGTSSRIDATTNRVDRLRLLGNGVVPQQVARAYLTLSERIRNEGAL